MNNGIHFLSGLPRSGSTLLGALLRQNPALHSGMSSPVSGLVGRLQGAMDPRSEFASLMTEANRRDVLCGVVEGFYRGVHAERTVVDTNRAWCSRLPLIHALYPDAKVIVCVRDLAWIMDSFERVLRANPLGVSRLFQGREALTVQTRADALAAPGGTVGFAWSATQEAFYGEHADKLIVVDYEALCREPHRALDAVYAKLGLAPFAHDVEGVAYRDGDRFDADLGLPGLHKVDPRVRFVERPTVLPPELFRRFSGRTFWRWPNSNPRGVEVVLPGAPAAP